MKRFDTLEELQLTNCIATKWSADQPGRVVAAVQVVVVVAAVAEVEFCCLVRARLAPILFLK